MSNLKEVGNHFFIDLCARKVFCRPCRKLCRCLVLPRFMQFWCATRECPNVGEVKLWMDGTWEVFGFEEKLHDNRLSQIVPKLLHSITTGHEIRNE